MDIIDHRLRMTLGGKGSTPMNSTPIPKAIEPDAALAARADERLAHAYVQIARADEQLARVTEQLAKMERDAQRPPSAGPGTQPPPGRPALWALIGLLLAAFIVVAGLVLQSSYSGRAKLIIARWAPQLVSNPPLPENPPSPAQPAPSIAQVAAAEAALPRGRALAQTAPQDAAPTAAAALPDHTQLLQTMARDLANVEREVEQLKANEQKTASDNSKAIEQLRASQEEMARLLARVSEQNLPKTSPPSTPAQPTPTARKPERTLRSPHARARPRLPPQWIYEEEEW